MTDEQTQRELRVAVQRFLYEIGKLPYPGSFGFFHSTFSELVEQNFEIKDKPWLNAYEAASVVNYVSLYGDTKPRPGARRIDAGPSLNALKRLWKLADGEGDYSAESAYEAAFTLRWVYQQIPFSLHPFRVARLTSLFERLLDQPDLGRLSKRALGIAPELLERVTAGLIDLFSRQHKVTEREFQSLDGDRMALISALSASRQQRTVFYRGKLKADSLVEMPYELNTSLRFPIASAGGDYYAPYPLLIGYAATRGLFFRLSEEHGDAFRGPFVGSFEALTAAMLARLLPAAEILTEEDERRLGWRGKTNDVTAIVGDSAVLVECKLSALFVGAKRTGSLAAVAADIRKQIADGQERRGLFQLHDKIAAIRSGLLPPLLRQKYSGIKRVFPILLLFDAISFANSPEVLGNLVRSELSAFGVNDFDYQIWHLEELSWLAQYAGPNAIDLIDEKFKSARRVYDLNSFVSDKGGPKFLRPCMFMPEGDTRARRVLRKLSEAYRHDLLS